MCLRRELSPPLLCATKYVHALRSLVNGHLGLPSPGQAWSSPANFRNDSATQLLLSHWRRGRVGEGPGGAVREGLCVRAWGGVPVTFVLRPCLAGLLGSLRRHLGRPLGPERFLGSEASCGQGTVGLGFAMGTLGADRPVFLFQDVFFGGRGGRPLVLRSPVGLSGADITFLENESVLWVDFRTKRWAGTLLRISLVRTQLFANPFFKKHVSSHAIASAAESRPADNGVPTFQGQGLRLAVQSRLSVYGQGAKPFLFHLSNPVQGQPYG